MKPTATWGAAAGLSAQVSSDFPSAWPRAGACARGSRVVVCYMRPSNAPHVIAQNPVFEPGHT